MTPYWQDVRTLSVALALLAGVWLLGRMVA